MSDETFAEIIAMLEEAYGIELSAERKRVWRLLLDPLPDRAAQEATVRLCRTSPYPPKPADLYRLVHGDPRDEERRLEDESEFAIAHLEEHLCDYRVVDLGPELNATVRAMGGPDAVVALMMREDWRFERRRAAMIYRALRRRGVSAEEGAAAAPAAVLGSQSDGAFVRAPFLPAGRAVAALPG